MTISDQTNPRLDAIFSALSDPSRRALLLRLAEGEASVSELAEPFDISQPAISKHLKVLEKSGLIGRGQYKASRPAYLKADVMKDAVNWLEIFRRFWGVSFDQLDDLLKNIDHTQKEHPDDE
jgi:DNA-binding transcriptional ArsR family regulator